ncbi:MAG: hypothetical protein ACI4S2_04210 [Lachnospiraceae bacterium]
MADLVLKVSKADYQNALGELQGNLNKLMEVHNSLTDSKAILEKSFIGTVGGLLTGWVDKNLRETENQIERVKNQIQKIQQYVEKMDTTTTKMEADVEEAAAKATSMFKSNS